MSLERDDIIHLFELAAASFFFTVIFLLFFASQGWITIAEGIPYVSSEEYSWRLARVNNFQGIYVTDVKMTPSGKFTVEAKNNMDSPVKLSEIVVHNRIDEVTCRCAHDPEGKIGVDDLFTVSCTHCVSKTHEEGEMYKIQMDIRQHYSDTGILRQDMGIIEGYYRT